MWAIFRVWTQMLQLECSGARRGQASADWVPDSMLSVLWLTRSPLRQLIINHYYSATDPDLESIFVFVIPRSVMLCV